MTEKPNCTFRYVFREGIINQIPYNPADFRECESAVGWIPTAFEPIPEPKDGEWWMCEIENEYLRPLILSDYHWYTTYMLGGVNEWLGDVTPLYKMVKAEDQ